MKASDEEIHKKHEDEEISAFLKFSRERTRERSYIIFVWQIAQDLVAGYDLTFSWSPSPEQTGRYCAVTEVNRSLPEDVQRRIENFLIVKGAKLFNLLPQHLRDFQGNIEDFTFSLDTYLLMITDSPKCPYRKCLGEENSLLKLIPKYNNFTL